MENADGDTSVFSSDFQNQTQPQTNPFSCNLCGRNYTRLDHLARHFRSHTHEKPFTCTHCGKTFARADLLKRHVTNHTTDGGPHKKQKTGGAPPRVRATRACVGCAESKLRCDGNEPCQRCLSRGTVCRYKPPVKRSSTANVRTDAIDATEALEVDLDGSSRPSTKNESARQTTLSSTVEVAGDERRQQETLADHPWTMGDDTTSPINFLTGNNMMVENPPSIEATGSAGDYYDAGLGDFLRDIIMPDVVSGDISAEARPDLFSPKDVLDFGVDTSLAWLDGYDIPRILESAIPQLPYNNSYAGVRFDDGNVPSANKSGHATPTHKTSLTMSAQAFKESLWRFIPEVGDSGRLPQFLLSMPMEDLVSSTRCTDSIPPCPSLMQRARDGLLACVLKTCDAAVVPRIVSSFPSAELMTNLIQSWVSHHKRQTNSWFHLECFDPNKEQDATLLSIISAGAALSRLPAVRRLGYAFLEAARAATEDVFESDNRNIRALRPCQSLALMLDVCLWSGDRRRMEIAESFAQPLVTMMRRGGHFRQPANPPPSPAQNDDAATLESKWATWIAAESMKRLASHLLIRDAESSMALLSPPLVSVAEMSISLPSSRNLWTARTGVEWRDRYMAQHDQCIGKWPSLKDCMDDVSLILAVQAVIDVSLSVQIILSGMWGFAWHFRQLTAVSKHSGSSTKGQRNSFLILNSMQQETAQRLEHFSMCVSELDELPTSKMMYHRQLMSLYVSLEDVQNLAGKAGEDEARKAYPLLSHWVQDRDSRQACWHAGQILRSARESRGGTLSDAAAVMLYHAGLVLWAYSILINSNGKHAEEGSKASNILLDQDDNSSMQRWLVVGKGSPAITPERKAGEQEAGPIAISEARRVMGVIIQLLRTKNNAGSKECPSLVENLNKLMRTLGNAAKGMRRMQESQK